MTNDPPVLGLVREVRKLIPLADGEVWLELPQCRRPCRCQPFAFDNAPGSAIISPRVICAARSRCERCPNGTYGTSNARGF
jgi:hypothetical protein